MNPIKEPCKKEVAKNNQLNNVSLIQASVEIPKMIEQSKKEEDAKENR